MNTPKKKITVASSWLDGCSGCHMSLMDLDQRLFELAEHCQIVYGPLVDAKTLPEQVDVGILEGAVSSTDDLAKARQFRQHCDFLISLGDCAVAGNVPSMRNTFTLDEVLDRAFIENAQEQPQRPSDGVPELLQQVLPLHAVVPVDLYLQGCPPAADTIWYALTELIAGRIPEPTSLTRFGA
jgi:NAD-reducing hydrogenase small subunit